MYIRWLSGEDVERALPMEEVVAAVKDAFVNAWREETVQPVRLRVDVEEANGLQLLMPSYDPSLGRTAVKLVSVFPDNLARNMPAITGIVVLFDMETGVPLALMDGAKVTALRTGAASGAAAKALARPDSRVLALLGAGAQAPYQALAVLAVRDIRRVHVYNRTPHRGGNLARWLRDRRPDLEVKLCDTVADAVKDADVVCTATAAQEPILFGADVKPGTHVNAVGSFRKDMREFDTGLLRAAGRVYVEKRDAAFEEAGELADAFAARVLKDDDLVEIGALLAGKAEGRQDDDEITVFKSTGIAAQDLHVAAKLFAKAERDDIGVRLST